MPESPKLLSEIIELTDDIDGINEHFYRHGKTDGLPIVPPTGERVDAMLGGTTRKPQDIIAEIAPQLGEATVEKIAINAVMAGCLPEYMPVIITAIEAMVEKQFNLYAIQATTHPCAPLVIVNGPIRKKLGLNSGYNAFGQGNRANATIGRAIRFALVNIGGGLPGKLDRSTQGQPSKYTYCIAENEEANPWQPLHVERGFAPSASTVTVCGVENPHNINDHIATEAEEMLTTVAGTMRTQGTNNIIYQCGEALVAFGPEHARIIADSGFSKQNVKHFLFEKARVPKSDFPRKHQEARYADFPDDTLIPVVREENDIMVMVVGGAGKHSCFIPSFGDTLSVTREIRL
ncbi:MAG: hypothetical protein HYX79_01680 [Chloroflexi bacterium]|nr:hypothetical protein [Chloroflexota bacterium]